MIFFKYYSIAEYVAKYFALSVQSSYLASIFVLLVHYASATNVTNLSKTTYKMANLVVRMSCLQVRKEQNRRLVESRLKKNFRSDSATCRLNQDPTQI